MAPRKAHSLPRCIDFYSKKIFLVLPEKIKDFAQNGLNDYPIFEQKNIDEDSNFYIDNDYIGIQIE